MCHTHLVRYQRDVINVENNDNLLDPIEYSSKWLHELSRAIIANEPECSVIPWSAYSANPQLVKRPKCISFLLPLSIQSPTMAYRTFDIIVSMEQTEPRPARGI